MIEGDGPADGDALPRRPHGPGHESRLARGGELIGRLPGEARRFRHQLIRLAVYAVIDQVALGAIERIGFDDIGAGFQISAMDAEHHIRPHLDQDFVAALQRGSAEIGSREVLLLQHGAHGSVDHQNATFKSVS